jgi:PAS domain S-box-containing protein
MSSEKKQKTKLKLLNRISLLRSELGSVIHTEQKKLYQNIGAEALKNQKTKVKLLDEIIFLTEQLNLIKSFQKELELKQIVDKIPQIIIVLDESLSIIYINNWLGMSKEDVIGKLFTDIFPKKRFAGLYNDFQLVIEKKKDSVETNIDFAYSDGYQSQLKLTLSSIDPDGYLISGHSNISVDFSNSIIGDYISMCAYCNKAKNILEQWIDISNFLKIEQKMSISHGICPKCFNKQIQEIS